MKIDVKIRGEKQQIIFTEDLQKYLHQIKVNYTNYFGGNSN